MQRGETDGGGVGRGIGKQQAPYEGGREPSSESHAWREKKIPKHHFVSVRSFFEAVLLARDAYTVYASLTPILASTLIATYTKSCFPYTQHYPVITLFVCVFHS